MTRRITNAKKQVPNEYLPIGTIGLPEPLVAAMKHLSETTGASMSSIVRAALIATYGPLAGVSAPDATTTPTESDF